MPFGAETAVGKTTFAVNLACVLSKRDVLVGLISSNLTYGELQTFFGQVVSPGKGLYEALHEDNPNIGGEIHRVWGKQKPVFHVRSHSLFQLALRHCYPGKRGANDERRIPGV